MLDSLVECRFAGGEVVVREGEVGDRMFFVEQGEAVASKLLDGKQTEVMRYKRGGYFGELALLDKRSLRKATVTAVSDLLLMSVDKEAFGRMLGPLEPILKRNLKKYEKLAAL